MKKLPQDSAPCEATDAGYVLTALSRLTEVSEFSWRDGRVYWEVSVPAGDEQAAHLKVRRSVDAARSLHR